MNNLFVKYRKWIVVTAGLMALALIVVVAQAAKPAPRTVAEPPAETEITFDMERNRAYTAEEGVIVIGEMVTPAAEKADGAPPVAAVETASEESQNIVTASAKVGGVYTLPEDAQMTDGSVGLLSIPKLKLSVSVFETDDEMEAMTHGLAHFKTTSAWDGNIAVCGHNVNFDLTDGYFKNIPTLKIGDTITYKTALGSRTYTVETVTSVAETDWSYLGRTEDNRLTLVTCISGQPRMRLIVQAVAI